MWVNPPWKLCQDAVDKLVKDCPAEFVMLGIKSKKPWAETLRTLRCEEVTLPKSVGNGFFVQLQSNGVYKPLPFPWWDLVAFHGFAENIEKYKSELLPPVVVRSTTATSSTPESTQYLNVQYAKTLTDVQLAEAKLLVARFADVFDDTLLASRIVGVECDIDTGDHAPLSCQPFQVSPAKRVKIDAKIEKCCSSE